MYGETSAVQAAIARSATNATAYAARSSSGRARARGIRRARARSQTSAAAIRPSAIAPTGQRSTGGWSGGGGSCGETGSAPARAATTEQHDEDEPEPEAPAQRASGGRERETTPAAAGEEVEGRPAERHDRDQEQQLERPAADGALAEVDRAAGRRRQLDRRIERGEQRLRRSAKLRQPRAVELGDLVAAGRRPTVRRGRDPHRRDPAAERRSLRAEAEGKPERDDLVEHAGVRRRVPALDTYARVGRSDERRRRRMRIEPADLEPRPGTPGDPVERDQRDGPAGERRVLREPRDAERSVRTSVRREEDERVQRRSR